MKRYPSGFSSAFALHLSLLLFSCSGDEEQSLGYIFQLSNPMVSDKFTENDTPFSSGNIDLPFEYVAGTTNCVVYSSAVLNISVKIDKTSQSLPADAPIISIFLKGYTVRYTPLESASRDDANMKITLSDLSVTHSQPTFIAKTNETTASFSVELVPVSKKQEFLENLANRAPLGTFNYSFPRYSITVELNFFDSQAREFTRTLSGTVVFGNQKENTCKTT